MGEVTVKRYDCETWTGIRYENVMPVERESGQWVRASAHAALQAENERLKGEIAEARRLALKEAAAICKRVARTSAHSHSADNCYDAILRALSHPAPAQTENEKGG